MSETSVNRSIYYGRVSLCEASLFIIAGISVERITAIVKLFQYTSIVTSSRVPRILVVIYAVCALVASKKFWDEGFLFPFVSTSIFICFSISIICHATIYKIMHRHRLQIHSQIQALVDTNARTSMASLWKVVFLNSALNPLLYSLRLHAIRLAVLQTIRWLVSREWVIKYCH